MKVGTKYAKYLLPPLVAERILTINNANSRDQLVRAPGSIIRRANGFWEEFSWQALGEDATCRSEHTAVMGKPTRQHLNNHREPTGKHSNNHHGELDTWGHPVGNSRGIATKLTETTGYKTKVSALEGDTR